MNHTRSTAAFVNQILVRSSMIGVAHLQIAYLTFTVGDHPNHQRTLADNFSCRNIEIWDNNVVG